MMHEQAIVEALLALAIEHAEKVKASKILRIYLVVGELSEVVEEYANFYFNFLSRDTFAAEASLFSCVFRANYAAATVTQFFAGAYPG
jgi:Zn finger protein HypA/HybF involved in hydrogenase expression